MNRWSSPLVANPKRRARTAAVGLAALALGALLHAQSLPKRAFPAHALRAQMVVLNAHEVALNGNTTRLAPGSRIRTPANALAVSGGLVGQTFVVNYTRDSLGQAHEIWILNAAEAADRRAGADEMPSFNTAPGAAPAQ